METKALNSQSLPDLSLQESGTLEGVFDLAVANNRSITDALEPGAELATASPRDSQVYNYYHVRGLTPATGAVDLPGGIGYMGIGIDFAVS
ncbi:hypothetical protein [Dysgonomonas termitidis]|uniref:Uncharacterized protein n=1 Tax=Dysgonomonas termitidis TaxID=1516126 RepID=A0ABV9KV93_9BACT